MSLEWEVGKKKKSDKGQDPFCLSLNKSHWTVNTRPVRARVSAVSFCVQSERCEPEQESTLGLNSVWICGGMVRNTWMRSQNNTSFIHALSLSVTLWSLTVTTRSRCLWGLLSAREPSLISVKMLRKEQTYIIEEIMAEFHLAAYPGVVCGVCLCHTVMAY